VHLLWIATKAPWPPVDGGRLLLWESLGALAAAGAEIDLVAPVDPAAFDLAAVAAALGDRCRPHLIATAPRSRLQAALRASFGGLPLSIARHERRRVRHAVAALVAARRPAAVLAEQLQALPQAEPARRAGIPILLRAQNVESDLWTALAAVRGGGVATFLRREARRHARYEGQAVARATTVVALSPEDAGRLGELAAGAGRLEVLRPPFPAELPPGPAPLPGDPAFVLFGSEGWPPNRDAGRWFLAAAWPQIHARAPGACLHVFGGEPGTAPGVIPHPMPVASAEAFASGSTLVLPLRVASGVRLRILEAWARGVPVIATPAAVSGLAGDDGVEWLVARDPDEFATAGERLATEPALRQRLVAAGRERLRRDHGRGDFARRLLATLERLALEA